VRWLSVVVCICLKSVAAVVGLSSFQCVGVSVFALGARVCACVSV